MSNNLKFQFIPKKKLQLAKLIEVLVLRAGLEPARTLLFTGF